MKLNGKSPINNRKAGFWVRFVATWIDLFIICVFLKVIMTVLEQFGVFDNFEYIAVLFLIAYLTIFVGGKGRTIGKRLCGLTVRQTNNKTIGYLKALWREVVGKFVAGIFVFLGFLWAAFSRSKRGWHDYIARTVVEQDSRAVKHGRWISAVILTVSILFIISKVGLFFLDINTFQKKNVLRPDAIDVSSLTEADHKPFVAYLQTNGKPPIEYVADKFKQHDVIILGEGHRVRETCEFVSDLVEPLYYQAGIRYLAMEFLKYKNTSLANQLVTGETYDEELVLDLFRDYGEIWGYQEYMDILKAVWQVNHTLPPRAEKFIVIGLDSDWDISVLRTGQSLWKVPGIIYRMATRDKFMAKVLDWSVVKKGKKVLAHVGGHHDFTRYRQPIVKNGELVCERSPRFGCILYQKYKDKIFQIMLHRRHSNIIADEPKSQPPLIRFLEDILAKNGNVSVGFDVEDTLFAPLRDSKNYLFAYQNYVIFSDIAQGYVFLKPLKELNLVSWADGFVNEENYEMLRDHLRRRGRIKKNQRQTPEELNESMRQWHEDTMKLTNGE